jgi:hypothetical protein
VAWKYECIVGVQSQDNLDLHSTTYTPKKSPNGKRNAARGRASKLSLCIPEMTECPYTPWLIAIPAHGPARNGVSGRGSRRRTSGFVGLHEPMWRVRFDPKTKSRGGQRDG